MQQLRERVDGFEVARRDVNAAITRLRGEIWEMDLRLATWYREWRDVRMRAQFAIRYETRLMIRDAWDRTA